MSTAPLVATPVATPCPSGAAMDLLGNGVPLSLLLDLAFGPHSEELMFVERGSGIPTPRPPAA